MARQLYGKPPTDWVVVDRDVVHDQRAEVSNPNMDYYWYGKDWSSEKHYIAPPVEATVLFEPIRSKILDEAKELINGERQQHYGPPSENFKRIAVGWSVLLEKEITPAQVARCMEWLKMARSVQGYKHDTSVDSCGYAALAGELEEMA